jgi:hypothetical protein
MARIGAVIRHEVEDLRAAFSARRRVSSSRRASPAVTEAVSAA